MAQKETNPKYKRQQNYDNCREAMIRWWPHVYGDQNV
jgi:hypothetical protein